MNCEGLLRERSGHLTLTIPDLPTAWISHWRYLLQLLVLDTYQETRLGLADSVRNQSACGNLMWTSLSIYTWDRCVSSQFGKWWFKGWFIYLFRSAEEIILGTWDIVWDWQRDMYMRIPDPSGLAAGSQSEYPRTAYMEWNFYICLAEVTLGRTNKVWKAIQLHLQQRPRFGQLNLLNWLELKLLSHVRGYVCA